MRKSPVVNGGPVWIFRGARLLAMIGVLIWMLTDLEVGKAVSDTVSSATELGDALKSAALAGKAQQRIQNNTQSMENNNGNDTQSRP